MSWTTGSQTEALSANSAVGTSFASFTSAQYIGPDATAAAYLPSNFFLPAYGKSKAIYVKAFGVLGTTSTPSLTLGLTGNTAQGTYNSSAIFATTGSQTAPASGSNMPWELDVLITCSATGGSGTFLADGNLKIYPTTTTILNMRCSSSTANPNTAASISTESAYYLELFATFSSSSSSNNIQCYNIAVLGLN
jgi:hypothetical protein